MAKIRGVKPDLWTDEDFVELSAYARLLWIGLWNFACDNGHIQDKSKQIKMRILPTDDVNCAELLREIEAQGLIERSDGWITVPNLAHHQKPHKRWFTTCAKPGCEQPKESSWGNPKRETTVGTPLTTGGTTVAQPFDGDGDGDGEVDSDGDSSATRPPARKRATQLPSNWQPNDNHHTLAAELRVNANTEAAQFRDHHTAKGSTMKDWDAAFRTWLRNAAKWRRPGEGGNAKPDTRKANTPVEAPPDGLDDQQMAAWWERKLGRPLASGQ